MNGSKNKDGSYSWYVPHNEPYIAAGDDTDYSRETGLVPSGSTFIEIDDQLTTSTNLATSYRLYPGISEEDNGNYKKYSDLSNFKVIADYQYNFIVTITENGLGIEQTTNLEFTSSAIANTSYKVKLPEKNNCYMIHPRIQFLNTDDLGNNKYKVKSVWEMPVHQRINEYWGNGWNIEGIGDPGNMINDDTEWQAEVIWQDINGRAFHFCDEYATDDSKSDVFNGLGKNPVYFMLDSDRLNETIKNIGSLNERTDIYGNILIGVKKKGSSEYLWSWHLWITDYDPNGVPAYSSTGAYLYYPHVASYGKVNDVDYQGYYNYVSASSYSLAYGGNVQHYFHDDNTSLYSEYKWTSTGNKIWDTGIYQNKWIMDRNLGAQAPGNADVRDPVEGFGMYYQYGRKDPFPYHGSGTKIDADKYKLYNIKGEAIGNWSKKAGPVDMNTGVKNPTTVYYNSGNTWTSNNRDAAWYSPEQQNNSEGNEGGVKYGKKTIFDPCPPGWCIPVFDAFDFLNRNIWYSAAQPVVAYANQDAADRNIRHFNLVTLKKSSSSANFGFIIPSQGCLVPSTGELAHPESTDSRGYFWVQDRSSDHYNVTVGTLNLYRGSPQIHQGQGFGCGYESGDNPNATTKTRNGYTYKIATRVGYRENFSASRGHNIRCIQVP